MVKVEPDTNNNLAKTSAADCFQIRSFSEERLIKKVGHIGNQTMEDIRMALSEVLNID